MSQKRFQNQSFSTTYIENMNLHYTQQLLFWRQDWVISIYQNAISGVQADTHTYITHTFSSSSQPEGHKGADIAKHLHGEEGMNLPCVGIWTQELNDLPPQKQLSPESWFPQGKSINIPKNYHRWHQFYTVYTQGESRFLPGTLQCAHACTFLCFILNIALHIESIWI